MSASPIPAFDHRGIVPPFVGDPTSRGIRSPYRVPLVELVRRFANTTERCKILDGFLKYRSTLHAAGVTDGFQWVDGSFLEKAEVIRTLPPSAPSDIDVVTFLRLADGVDESQFLGANANLFSRDENKTQFHVDAFTVSLSDKPEDLISNAAYWYSVWSHQRRTFAWKGFVEIDLNPTEDEEARKLLDSQSGEMK